MGDSISVPLNQIESSLPIDIGSQQERRNSKSQKLDEQVAHGEWSSDSFGDDDIEDVPVNNPFMEKLNNTLQN